jgi:outer membrane protein assembly factor BamB
MYQLRSDHNAVIARDNFAVTWNYNTKAKINGGLAVVGNTLFLDDFADEILALDALTGNLRWRATTDNIVMSTPIVSRGLVYVGTGHNGAAGAMNDHNGGGGFAYALPVGATDLIKWGRPEGDHVIALDAATGAERWKYRTAGEDMPSPALVADMLVFANGDFHAYGLDPSRGEAAWQRDLNGISTMASASVSGSRAIVSVCSGPKMQGHTIALDAHTGKIVWNAAVGDCDSAPTLGLGRVFVSGVDGNAASFGYGARGVVTAIDEKTGKVEWSYRSSEVGPYTQISSNERAIAGTYADGYYFQSIPTSNELVAFDPATGRVRWRLRTAGPIKMSPVVKHGVLYVGDTVGLFYRIEAARGIILHVRMFDQPFTTSPPVIVGSTIFVVNGSTVYAIPLSSS